jgi:hypothetical protein
MRILIATLSLTISLHAADRVDVPRAAAPKVDGSIASEEWKDAAHVMLNGGGEAYLKHDGTFLYIAMKAPRNGIGSLCSLDGNHIVVLHASAALGTAEFDSDGKLTRGFTWTNRDTGQSEAAMAERKTFLEDEKWFANSTPPPPTSEREYQILIDGRREIPMTLAFMSFAGSDDFKMHVWPAKLADACADMRLARGSTDVELAFDPRQWGVLVLE